MSVSAKSEFNPEQLRVLLELKGWSQRILASRMGITATTLSMLINGKLPFSLKHAENASMVGDMPLNFFVLRHPPIPESNLTFRKTSSLSRSGINAVKSEYSLLTSAVEAISTMCQTQDRSAWIEELAPFKQPTMHDIEEIAAQTRQHLSIPRHGPVPNVMRAVESGGIAIAAMSAKPKLDSTESTKMEGITSPTDSRKPVTIGYFPGSRTGDGIRFTIAHELGHAILQRNRRPESNKIREAEASLFASSFLFPKSDAEASIRPEMTLSDFVDIKTGWGISIAAIVRRSMDLGIITPERYRSLQIQINQMHWRKTEPVQVEEEHPIYFKQMIGGALGTIKSPTLVEVAPTAIEQYLGVPFSMADKWADGLTAQEADWDQYPF